MSIILVQLSKTYRVQIPILKTHFLSLFNLGWSKLRAQRHGKIYWMIDMVNKVVIGLEAHDGTGKSDTSEVLIEIFGGVIPGKSKEIEQINNELKRIKNDRRLACEPIDISKKFSTDSSPESDEYNYEIFEKTCKKIDESYVSESNIIMGISSKFIVMDRTWASHAAERFYQSRINDHENKYLDEKEENILWPENVIKPDITFEMIVVPDSTRVDRMLSRSKQKKIEINPRERKLNSDKEYRTILQNSREKLGCQRIVFTAKRPGKVCGLRISQSILGSFDCPPMDANLDDL